MNQFLLISAFTFFAVIFSKAVAKENVVPVLLWEKDSNTPLVPALQRIGQKSFANILSQRFHQDNHLLVFVEESLSPEDFSTFKSGDEASRSKLKSVKNDNTISYLPFVHNPVEAIKELYPTALETSIQDLSDEVLANNKVIIVRFDQTNGKETSKSDRFKSNSLKAFEAYEKLAQSNSHVTGIITGTKGSLISPEERVLSRSTRSVVSSSNADGTQIVFLTNNTLLYVNNPVTLSVNGSEVTFSANGTTFEGTETDTQITNTLSGNGTEIMFIFTLSTNGYWSLSNISVTQNSDTRALVVENVYAPTGFSYTCNNEVFYVSGNRNYNLRLPGFQVQPFFDAPHNSVFGDPYNCVGFTSIPIWSGLFVTFMLILILTFGLIFMFDIRTMDRFDDPKGKTIVINASE